MAGGRGRRRGRARQTLLPIHFGRAPNTVSWWYCDLKIYAFNDSLFSFGHRYARFLKVWFSVGAAFSCVAFAGVSMMLLWNFFGAFQLCKGTFGLNNVSLSWLFGTSYLLPGLSMSIMDVGIVIASTLVSVSVHEFGHAIAAASEGLQIEYIAVFVTLLFPGALVAFDDGWLQSLPHFSALRIHSAGIWHNLVFCAVCVLTLFSLPMILHPLYIHNEGPLVLNVAEESIMSDYLSPGDIITAVDGSDIKYPHDWVNKMADMKSQMLGSSNIEYPQSFQALQGKKGYCVPNSLIMGNQTSEAITDQFSCPDELAAFVSIPCSNSTFVSRNQPNENIFKDKHCLVAKEVVKLKKCGDGWNMNETDRTSCPCSQLQEESCMTPVQLPGISWVEIAYSSPYSSRCSQQIKNTSGDKLTSGFGSTSCGGIFVYVGDVHSVAQSLQLSAYRPRWAYTNFIAYAPYILEKILTFTFLVSASLALFNSLPVFFLDGQSILETILFLITWLDRRQRHTILLRSSLVTGTILSIVLFSSILCLFW